jgi:tripartite-type tricarboxylate transporter receptor subunit TctC
MFYWRARRLIAVTAITITGISASASAQTYPERPVKLVTQGAAGSGPDVIARIVTDHLGRLWGQQLVIINQPGAGGTAAARTAASAAPDGYTLYIAATSTFLVMPLMFPNQPFDIDRDFVRVGFVGEQPMVFGAAPSLGVSTLPELVALSKKRPGEILYAANLRGTFPHLTVERLRKETGADLNFVPYPGAEPLHSALVSSPRLPEALEPWAKDAIAIRTPLYRSTPINVTRARTRRKEG